MTFTIADHQDSPIAPARQPFAIQPNDADPLPLTVKAIYVGTAGDLTLRGVSAAADVVFKNVAAGQVIDVHAQYVRATGTTAGDLVGLA